ncbi:UDP-N-acetylmuramoylalanyl-D-glutamyl-2,6-diamin opimelate/D-alanyl-D-alanylligase [Thermocrinis albus DSM 14484]|uniref:UDP-N-acetylmuramoyl-tripeptide--D-alanyl-D-alanine ligase n=1 Tax=Thermocrinis albus (strain DSM 14484 / JCM 11386 / HI 11/12) TaxID=638303 RepID=D3SP23_THEAH|nr:UDP-N-acetylmuramoyl-tripeptide--D-alanyl-D-alanine ligase [Thermocrinis albus]ADC88910.1 UDP-N-acetylmuramoylalanyl-D-glutamyl-2,6-diamin opimelate/D-alanyl-D-alanylligase [Thermocrinis albus DSM 14484]
MKAYSISVITGGRLIGENCEVKRFVTDSRQVEEGDVFVALKGQKHDGHSFVEEAFRRGAVGVVVEREVPVKEGKFALVVEDSLKALRSIALFKRNNFKGKVVGIAGSAGKTTTKELVAHLLSAVGKVCKTPKNYNSQIGVPLSVANFPEDCDFWVIEMGASAKGDVAKLTQLVIPHVRVITSIGEEHLETFGCLDDVILGNGEILEGMREDHVAVLPSYVAHCYRVERAVLFGEGTPLSAQDLKLTVEGVRFVVKGKEIFLPVPSLALVENILCSLGVMEALGVDWTTLLDKLTTFRPVEGRFRTLSVMGATIIDDSYNANPLSVKKAIESLSLMEGHRIAVLGDMLELGEKAEELHRDVGRWCAEKRIDECIFYGYWMRYAFHEAKRLGVSTIYLEDKGEVVQHLRKKLREGTIILVKGSRGMKMEEVITQLLQEHGVVF